MKMRGFAVLAAIMMPAAAATFVARSIPAYEACAVSDPRQEPPTVCLVTASRPGESARGFTGTIVQTLGEPGQVVSAGQTVLRLAQSGPREAVVALPETIRPAIGSLAEASLYGSDGRRYTAHLRQLSDSADAQTRTYEARYVLDGEAAAAPLGATVTIRLASQETQPEVQVPLGAVLDDGRTTGVWVFDSAASTVHFRPVKLARLTSESAVISGLSSDDRVVSLGAHLLQEGARVRTASE